MYGLEFMLRHEAERAASSAGWPTASAAASAASRAGPSTEHRRRRWDPERWVLCTTWTRRTTSRPSAPGTWAATGRFGSRLQYVSGVPGDAAPELRRAASSSSTPTPATTCRSRATTSPTAWSPTSAVDLRVDKKFVNAQDDLVGLPGPAEPQLLRLQQPRGLHLQLRLLRARRVRLDHPAGPGLPRGILGGTRHEDLTDPLAATAAAWRLLAGRLRRGLPRRGDAPGPRGQDAALRRRLRAARGRPGRHGARDALLHAPELRRGDVAWRVALDYDRRARTSADEIERRFVAAGAAGARGRRRRLPAPRPSARWCPTPRCSGRRLIPWTIRRWWHWRRRSCRRARLPPARRRWPPTWRRSRPPTWPPCPPMRRPPCGLADRFACPIRFRATLASELYRRRDPQPHRSPQRPARERNVNANAQIIGFAGGGSGRRRERAGPRGVETTASPVPVRRCLARRLARGAGPQRSGPHLLRPRALRPRAVHPALRAGPAARGARRVPRHYYRLDAPGSGHRLYADPEGNETEMFELDDDVRMLPPGGTARFRLISAVRDVRGEWQQVRGRARGHGHRGRGGVRGAVSFARRIRGAALRPARSRPRRAGARDRRPAGSAARRPAARPDAPPARRGPASPPTTARGCSGRSR